jgi:hypothetical protein
VALPKEGLRASGGHDRVGELNLADISVPLEHYAGTGLDLEVGPIFAQDDIIRLG